jgi:DNA processing protein
MEEAMETCGRLSVGCTWFGADHYPEPLSSIPDPPAVLFFRGGIAPCDLPPCAAVIGSRRCSMYGRRVARTLAGELAAGGAAVVSGLARGIDAEAHRGALDSGGITAAVLGSGVDVIYPAEHRGLAERIVNRGCVVSEYPPGTAPARHAFPERNRLISGLSRVVVVVEAGEKSGTMITVGTALDQGREVLAVPGEITCTSAVGSNRLIRDGAGMALDVSDVFRAMGVEAAPGRTEPSDDPLEALLRKGEASPDELAARLGVDLATVWSRLLDLEIRGLAVRRPGGLFVSAGV